MKAIDILKWISCSGVTSEYFGVVNMGKDFDFKSFFGYSYDVKEYGNYFYYYSDGVDYDEIAAPIDNFNFRKKEPVKPTFSIDTMDTNRYGEKVFIHFYKIDD